MSKLSAKKENLDPAFLGENLEKLFAYVDKVRMEIAALNLPEKDSDHDRFQAMSKQLDGILEATVDASDKIMGAVEKKTKRLRNFRHSSVMMNSQPSLKKLSTVTMRFLKRVRFRTSPVSELLSFLNRSAMLKRGCPPFMNFGAKMNSIRLSWSLKKNLPRTKNCSMARRRKPRL